MPQRAPKRAINNSRPTRQGAVRLGKQRAQVNSNAATRKIGCLRDRIFDGLVCKSRMQTGKLIGYQLYLLRFYWIRFRFFDDCGFGQKEKGAPNQSTRLFWVFMLRTSSRAA
jgi:hypothetical protein